jgi:hypothetical protein
MAQGSRETAPAPVPTPALGPPPPHPVSLPADNASRLCHALEAAARRRGHAFSYSDHIHLSLGWGAGHAACHALFFFASLLPLTTGGGSLYLPACPAMSVFTLSALNTLGASAALVAAMVVALEGWRRRRADEAAFAPAVHAAAGLLVRARGRGRAGRGGAGRGGAGRGGAGRGGAGRGGAACARGGQLHLSHPQAGGLSSPPPRHLPQPPSQPQTLGNFRQGGCVFVAPAMLGLGLASAAWAARCVWRHAPPPPPLPPPSPSPQRTPSPRELRRDD